MILIRLISNVLLAIFQFNYKWLNKFFLVMITILNVCYKLGQTFHKRTFGSVLKNSSSTRRRRLVMDTNLKCREDPIVTKLDSAEFKSIFTPEVLDLKKIFDKYNYEIRIAGGAVRDLLLGQKPTDLDFATVATPQEMKDMFTEENIRMINMNGEKHGTITPRINDKENFEVTTLRVDVVTDGRRAEVEFTKEWKLDANRRDLTINSMFLGFDGSVYDYYFGYEDLQKRRVAFVGNADCRVKEDCLRILRYFRFYGKVAEYPDQHEKETLEILKTNMHGLENVSGERIWVELYKILKGNYAKNLLKTMLELGIGPFIGLLENPNIKQLDAMLKRGEHLGLHPISYLAALLNDLDEVTLLHSRLKFSKFDRDFAYFLVENRNISEDPERPLLPYEKLVLCLKIKQKQNDVIEYVKELLKYKGEEKILNSFNEWKLPIFPINGHVLKENGVTRPVMYRGILNELKNVWIDSEYKKSKEDLVKLIPDLIKEMKE